MTPDSSLRAADRRVIGLLAAFFFAVVALLALSEVPAPDATRLASRTAASSHPHAAPARAALGTAAAAVAERWAADESAQGMRSESAH